MAAVSELAGGHAALVARVQTVQYEVNMANPASRAAARAKLHTALANISAPVRVVFGSGLCKDCGQRGDERLLSDYCHEVKNCRNILKSI